MRSQVKLQPIVIFVSNSLILRPSLIGRHLLISVLQTERVICLRISRCKWTDQPLTPLRSLVLLPNLLRGCEPADVSVVSVFIAPGVRWGSLNVAKTLVSFEELLLGHVFDNAVDLMVLESCNLRLLNA